MAKVILKCAKCKAVIDSYYDTSIFEDTEYFIICDDCSDKLTNGEVNGEMGKVVQSVRDESD